MLIPVIMAGGVGSRLWPASREAYPKQFLTFSSAGGQAGSLFQQSLSRLAGLPDLAPPIVVCNAEHRFLVGEQLAQLAIEGAMIILEPVGRNTAPAVALAALAARDRYGDDARLLVLAADHVITNLERFHTAIRLGADAARSGALVTFGIVPQHPETGYGYIQRGPAQGALHAVAGFVEKPDLATAERYLATGEYYWNSGMFLFSAGTFLAELERLDGAIHGACLRAWQGATRDLDFWRIPAELFADCPANSIDYAVMEKTVAGVVVPLDAGWNDLGAWSAVWAQGAQDDKRNVCQGDVLLHDAQGSFVQAESRLVALVGMDDTVVVETSDAVLVAHRDRVQDVKEIVRLLAAKQRPETMLHRRVYRPWGSYEGLVEAPGFQVKRIIVNPGAALSLQLHHKRSEHWIVVQGTATVTCGESCFELQANESTYIPVETKHRLENRTQEPVTLIEVQCGSYLGEDDIVRFEDIYGRRDA